MMFTDAVFHFCDGVIIEVNVKNIFMFVHVLFCSPVTYAWQGGASLQQDQEFFNMTVSREEYEEEGHNLCFEKFDI